MQKVTFVTLTVSERMAMLKVFAMLIGQPNTGLTLIITLTHPPPHVSLKASTSVGCTNCLQVTIYIFQWGRKRGEGHVLTGACGFRPAEEEHGTRMLTSSHRVTSEQQYEEDQQEADFIQDKTTYEH